MINAGAFLGQERAIPFYNRCTLIDKNYTNAPLISSKLLLRLKRSTWLHFLFTIPFIITRTLQRQNCCTPLPQHNTTSWTPNTKETSTRD